MQVVRSVAIAAMLMVAGTCTFTIKHEVEPIHVTVDVYVKVEKELDNFFDFETQRQNEQSPKPETKQN